jgi:hypothetical protein
MADFLIAIIDELTELKNSLQGTSAAELSVLLENSVTLNFEETPKPINPKLKVMTDGDGVAALVKQIVKNFCSSFEGLSPLPLPIDVWIRAFTVLHEAIASNSKFIRNIKLSIYTCVSRVRDPGTFNEVISYAAEVVPSSPYNRFAVLPEYVQKFVRTQCAKKAYGAHYHSNDFDPPPRVIAVDVHTNLRGFLCLNGCIAVNRVVLINARISKCGLVDLGTLVGHEGKHVDVRMYDEDFNTHTPDKEADDGVKVDESGIDWEKAMWGGYLPDWSSPIYPEKAEKLANEIVDSVMHTDQFILSSDWKQRMIANLKPASAYQGACNFHRHKTFA